MMQAKCLALVVVFGVARTSSYGISQDLCIPSGGDQVCSNHGNCVFGKCHCEDNWTGQFCTECADDSCSSRGSPVNCDSYRSCIEGALFGQYWKHFASAYECHNKCTKYKFIDPQPDLDGNSVCTMEYDPVCGLDGRVYSNRCSSKVAGVAVQCEGECPCPQSAAVCEFHKNLDGDNVCPPYKFVVDGNTISVYRPPCLADDLEVNVGVWRGESASKDGATYPNGWGVLTYKLNDTLNRDKYKGNMVYGVREGHGALYWKDKSYYSGTWKNNKKHGEGTLFYANGDIYTGTWSEETKTGQGKYFYATGGKYIGGFKNGGRDGQGRSDVPQPDDQWEYFDGDYINGTRNTGAYNTSSGYVYTGGFSKNGHYEGSGVYIWACGKKYVGSFSEGALNGEGTLTYPQGWTYTGSFSGGKLHGEGKFSWSEVHYFQGKFENGRMTGEGVYAFADGGLFDSSAGLYYPNRDDKSKYFEAHFDGHTLRVNKAVKAKPTGSPYG